VFDLFQVDYEFVPLVGCPPSLLGGLCCSEISVEDCEWAQIFPSWDL
jgi:hypothetical protein